MKTQLSPQIITHKVLTAGIVFDIQRFAIHDGPGIRTTVFLKGCPLSCLWCHNPESQDPHPEIFFSPEKCIGCRYCESVCEQDGHHFIEGVHVYDRSGCIRCGECAMECYARALEVAGKEMTVEEVIAEVVKDRVFYQNSGGGMTLSGGEPMQQFEFARDILKSARENGLHNCIETSGCSSWERYAAILPYVDLFLYDIKETDPALHRQYTGVSNELLLENLFKLDQAGARIMLRCPIIPGLNDRAEHFQAIAGIANRMQNVLEINLLPYHPLGNSKNQHLGKELPLTNIPIPGDAQTHEWLERVQSGTTVVVRKD
jgi:glycyl-radical enzyme activating protein